MLNSAQYISQNGNIIVNDVVFGEILKNAEIRHIKETKVIIENTDNVDQLIKKVQIRKSDNVAAIRNADNMKDMLYSTNLEIASLDKVAVKYKSQIYMYYKR